MFFALKTIKPYRHVFFLLTLETHFRKVITAWSSGTGSAGPVGSLLYAGITHMGISPRDCVRIMLIVPAIQATAFWMLLRAPRQPVGDNKCVKNIAIIELNVSGASHTASPDVDVHLSGVKAKLKFIPKLISFIAPLVIVFIFEYICVSGLVCTRFESRSMCNGDLLTVGFFKHFFPV